MSNALMVGILGNAEVPRKTIHALIADRVAGTKPSFVIPMSEEHWTPAVRAVAAYALDKGHPYELVVDGTEADLASADEVLGGAAAKHVAASVETKLVSLLAGADDGILTLAWSDEDDACQRALSRALKRGVPAYDLGDALNDLKFDDEPAEELQATTPEPREHEDREAAQAVAAQERESAAALEPVDVTEESSPPPPAKRTRRTKAQMEAAREAERRTSLPPSEEISDDDEAQQPAGFNLPAWNVSGSAIVPGTINATSNGNGQRLDIEEWLRHLIKDAVREAMTES